ncbi:MAG: zinc-ribbon domain-containing protein [Butyrivibrio sp.]|nr:zinc-ribbon domain-containing protein [Butyrivibrio sp.]
MFCPNCGSEVGDNNKFCPSCGADMQTGAMGGDTQRTNTQYSQNTNTQYTQSTPTMDATATGVVAYITWIGFLIAYLAGDRENAKFHLNQALVYHLFSMLSVVPFVGWIWGIFMFICFILGIIAAANREEKPLPIIGGIRILN